MKMRRLFQGKKFRRLFIIRHRAGVRQNDDFGLKPFGGMNRHHPHHIARLIEIAFDGSLGCFHLGNKADERGRAARFMGEGRAEKFIENIRRFLSQTRQKRMAAPLLAQNAHIKGKGRQFARPKLP